MTSDQIQFLILAGCFIVWGGITFWGDYLEYKRFYQIIDSKDSE